MMIVSLLALAWATTTPVAGPARAQSSDAAAEERVRALLREPTVPATLPRVEGEIRQFLAAGANPNAPDRYGRTAVHYAAGRDSFANSGTDRLLRVVLDGGGRCCDEDPVGDTPLHYAAAEGIDGLNDERIVLAAVRELLARGADANARNLRGYTPLHFAAKAATLSRERLVRALLDAGADRNRAAGDGNTPVHLAAGDSVRLDSGHGHDNFSSSELTQPGMGNPQGLKVLQVLLDGPVNVNARNGGGLTPLLVVLHEDALATTADAVTPLAAEALLDAGADPNVVRGDGLSPLHLVLAWPELRSRRASSLAEVAVPLVEALLDAGADVDHPNPDGDTPLHAAVRMGWDTGMVNVLLAAGADPCIRNAGERYFPDQLARHHGASEVERALGLAGGFQLDCEERELGPDARKRIQACLKEQGFDPGAPDGVFGPRTRAAIRAWQDAQGGFGQDSPGALSADSAARLLETCEKKADEDEKPDEATSDDASGPEPRCTGQPGPACWMETANQPGCFVWNPNPEADETVTWSGPCVGGKASGHGEFVWRFREDGRPKTSGGTGEIRDGITLHGHWVERYSSGEVWEGPYVNDRRHGHWVKRGEDGVIWSCRQDGERVDASTCETSEEGRMQVMEAVTLRSGPGDDYEEIGRLADDAAVEVQGAAAGWVRVATEDGRGGLVPQSALTEVEHLYGLVGIDSGGRPCLVWSADSHVDAASRCLSQEYFGTRTGLVEVARFRAACGAVAWQGSRGADLGERLAGWGESLAAATDDLLARCADRGNDQWCRRPYRRACARGSTIVDSSREWSDSPIAWFAIAWRQSETKAIVYGVEKFAGYTESSDPDDRVVSLIWGSRLDASDEADRLAWNVLSGGPTDREQVPMQDDVPCAAVATLGIGHTLESNEDVTNLSDRYFMWEYPAGGNSVEAAEIAALEDCRTYSTEFRDGDHVQLWPWQPQPEERVVRDCHIEASGCRN